MGGAMKRVLIVDDESVVRGLLRHLVETSGYEVCGMERSGASAVGRFIELRPDLVLLDVELPGRDGVSVLRGIREVDQEALGRVCKLAG